MWGGPFLQIPYWAGTLVALRDPGGLRCNQWIDVQRRNCPQFPPRLKRVDHPGSLRPRPTARRAGPASMVMRSNTSRWAWLPPASCIDCGALAGQILQRLRHKRAFAKGLQPQKRQSQPGLRHTLICFGCRHARPSRMDAGDHTGRWPPCRDLCRQGPADSAGRQRSVLPSSVRLAREIRQSLPSGSRQRDAFKLQPH